VEKVEKKLREEAKKLLAEKKVDVIVGYEAGTLPLTATPVFITTPEEADKLVWNAFCQHNLAKYVHDLIIANRDSQKRLKPEDRKRKVVGVVTKGCTSRSLVIHLQERQYERLDTVILGVPCTGYVDRKKLAVKLGGEDILEGTLDGANLKVRTASGEKTVALKEVMAENCLTCRINNPVISDAMMGEPAPPMDAASEYLAIDEFEKLSP
jgi:formate dehydrogenase (coenzyme F420) beta subunit